MLNWDNSSTWTYPGCCYWTDSRENYFFEDHQALYWLPTNTKLKKNAKNSKTETRLCIVTPSHTVHSYEIVKDNKGGYYDGVAPWPAVPLFFQTAPPWWSLLLLHSNISFLLRTCSHILPSFFGGVCRPHICHFSSQIYFLAHFFSSWNCVNCGKINFATKQRE